jgi:Protein of unknown function (DUF992)
MQFRSLSKLSLSLAAASAVTLALTAAVAAAPVGQLDCHISGGVGFIITSDKALNCEFQPVHGEPQHYVGTIRKFGLDLGISGPGRLTWTVVSTGFPHPGELAGSYVGADASVSAGVGAGANALVGGNNHHFTLQPLSVEVQSGVALSAGVGDMTLEYDR